MKFIKCLPILVVIFFLTCTDTSVMGPSDMPNMAYSNMYVNIPSCVTGEDSSEVTLAKSLNTQSEFKLIDLYKPIPIYIRWVDSAQRFAQNFIDEIAKNEIPMNSTFSSDGLNFKTIYKNDSLGQEYSQIIIQKDTNLVANLRYFVDKNGNTKGKLRYIELPTQNLVDINYDNQGEKTISRVTFHLPKKNLRKDSEDPQTIMLKIIKNENLMQISGISYLPNEIPNTILKFTPSFYAFTATINIKSNIAAMKVALVPKNIPKEDIFKKYSLDKIIMNLYVKNFISIFETDSNIAKAAKWSIENKSSIPKEENNPLWVEIIKTPLEGFYKNFGVDELIAFTKFNILWMKNNKNLKSLVTVVETRQPIFLKAKAEIYGNGFEVPVEFKNTKFDSIETLDANELINYK